MTPIDLAAWLGAGYGLVLLGVAHLIDRLARRSHNVLQDQRTSGFVYHESHDAWLCPEDQWLYPRSFDPENRVMRYRGLPLVCNSCPVKETCTASDAGREVRRPVDTWPASESAKFHRGIACAVTVLAVLFPGVTALTVSGWPSQLLALGVAALVAAASLPLWTHLMRTPVDPHGVFVQSLDDTEAERTATADVALRQRTTYASDARTDHAI
ncbi:MAG: hypothetical protein L0G22_02875 [Propionibacteriaceae bacterium]|nr:hypothetical protein [Propionibacteriaceae bacterium]